MERLNLSLSDFFLFFEISPDLICIVGKDGFIKKINPSIIRTLEYSEAELFESPMVSFIHPDDRETTSTLSTKLYNGDAVNYFENRYITKSGKTIWMSWTSRYLKEKELIFSIGRNITENKNAETTTKSQLKRNKALAYYFKNKVEKDRKYFAVELHDDLAQLAATIKLNIEYVEMNTNEVSVQVKERINNISTVSRLLIENIKKVVFNVRPYMLDDIGLTETLIWYCNEFSYINKIPCSFDYDFDEELISQTTKLDFFRICQEALANIINHAKASSVKVILKHNATKVYLSIIDDGKGFNPSEMINANTPGFTSMQELITSIDGELIIESEIGKGSNISISTPIKIN